MNEVLTSALLKGLEATQKVNKGMGKLNMDKITVSVEGDTMTINSAYFNHQAKMTMPVYGGQNFSVGITGLEKMIKALKKFDTYTTFEVEGVKVTVSDGKKKMQLALSDSYKLEDVITNNSFAVDGVRLNEAYTKVKKSIAKESSRPILTGVHFKNDYIETVDGFRISQVKITDNEFAADIVADPKMLELVIPVAKKDKLEVIMSHQDGKFTVSTGSNDYTLSVTGRLLEGDFLKTEQVFTNDYEHMVSLSENKEIVNELEFIKDMVGTADSGKPNPIKLLLNNDKITLADEGECTSSTVNFDRLDGSIKDTFKIAFNPNFLLDAIKNISDEFTMQFISPMTGCIIKNENEKYLVLPVRL